MVLWTTGQAERVAGIGAPAGGHAVFQEVLGPWGSAKGAVWGEGQLGCVVSG